VPKVLAASARRIPIELQRLLAEMTALDQSAITTKRLVDAFGWSDLDMREQHDVQELNRVLCDAIHRSLVGTPGGGMVPSLYNGVFVWTTQCFKCCDNPSVSEREEPFQVCLSCVARSHVDTPPRICLADRAPWHVKRVVFAIHVPCVRE
jgi:hypothetical protein